MYATTAIVYMRDTYSLSVLSFINEIGAGVSMHSVHNACRPCEALLEETKLTVMDAGTRGVSMGQTDLFTKPALA